MASADPLAALIFANLVGVLLVPVLWLSLGFWQRRRKLLRLSALSLIFATSPAVAFGLFYLPVDSGVALLAFGLFLPVNALAFLVAAGASQALARKDRFTAHEDRTTNLGQPWRRSSIHGPSK